MAYEPLTPLPFLPIPGAFNLNTFIPGSSDYEIMARLVETYNKAVELFNQIIAQYSDIDATITELTKEYQKQLDNYKADTDAHITSFENDINITVNGQNSKITELAATVVQLQKDIDGLLNGAYIDNYVKALATWIDNNLQQLVAKVVKYVWFEVDESGYFVAYIPDTWDFVDFGTELDPDNEDYGKLVLDWEPLVPDDPAFQTIPEPPATNVKTAYVTNKETANTRWDKIDGASTLVGDYALAFLALTTENDTTNKYLIKTLTINTTLIQNTSNTSPLILVVSTYKNNAEEIVLTKVIPWETLTTAEDDNTFILNITLEINTTLPITTLTGDNFAESVLYVRFTTSSMQGVEIAVPPDLPLDGELGLYSLDQNLHLASIDYRPVNYAGTIEYEIVE